MILYTWYGASPRFYNRVLQFLRNQNILFTKIFQSLSNSKITLDHALRSELQRYTTNTSYSETEINYECLDQIEQDYDLTIDRHVINSGMIALVFKGQRKSGEPVIIKLKRNNIHSQLSYGCQSIAALHQYFSFFFPKNTIIRILYPFIKNIKDIIKQCDFDNEIQNLKQAKDDFAPLDFIQIPIVYNLTNTRPSEYIIMELIQGVHVLPPDVSNDKRADYFEKYVTFRAYAFFFNTILHSDLHSGNFLFTPTGLGIIDFGMAINASDAVHDMIMSVASIIMDETPIHEIEFIDTFKDLFVPALDKDSIENVREVEDAIIMIAQPLISVIDINELSVIDTIDNLSILLKQEIQLNKDIYSILLGLSMAGGDVSIFGPALLDHELNKKIHSRAIAKVFSMIY